MSFEVPSAHALDVGPCRYGDSRLLVRGPQRDLDQPFVAALGSSDTYGKFVDQPFAARIETALGMPCVNFGCVNAGVDAFLNDDVILGIAGAAKAVIVQVMGAQNLSNRFYRVHPRRNDRFLEPTVLLTKIYPEVDFTEFHFNKHMLQFLRAKSADRFDVIQQELQAAWVGRMKLFLKAIKAPVLLAWLRHDASETVEPDFGADPLFVTRAMLDQIENEIGGLAEIRVQTARQTGDLYDMKFGPLEAPVAEQSIGQGMHAKIAETILSAFQDLK